MKTLSILSLLILLTSCAGGNVSSMKFGKRCTKADASGLKKVHIFGLSPKMQKHHLTQE